MEDQNRFQSKRVVLALRIGRGVARSMAAISAKEEWGVTAFSKQYPEAQRDCGSLTV